MLERNKPPGGLGAIYPPMLNTDHGLSLPSGTARRPPSSARRSASSATSRCTTPAHPRAALLLGDLGHVRGPARARARQRRQESSAKPPTGCSRSSLHRRRLAGQQPAGQAPAPGLRFDNPVYPDTETPRPCSMALLLRGPPRRSGFSAASSGMHTMQPRRRLGARSTATSTSSSRASFPGRTINALLDRARRISPRIIEMFGYIGSHPERAAHEPRPYQFLKKSQRADGSWFESAGA